MSITTNPSTTTLGCIVCQPSTVLTGIGHVAGQLAEAAKKAAFITSIYLTKASLAIGSALRQTGNFSWNATKALGSGIAVVSKLVANAAAKTAVFAGQQTVAFAQIVASYLSKATLATGAALRTGANVTWSAAKTLSGHALNASIVVGQAAGRLMKQIGQQTLQISQKAAHATAAGLSKAAQVTGQVCVAAKDGAVQGFLITKGFVATHQKETVIVGCALAVGMAAMYAVDRLIFTHSEKTAKA
jgi:hypothetical protein